MQPKSLGIINLSNAKTPTQRLEEGGWISRHGNHPKGTILSKTQVKVCPRVKVADLPEGFLKQNHVEALERNQNISSCCRHPENHEIEGFKSHKDEKAPDIYIFYCTCGKKHRFLCVGATDEKRPYWDAS